MKKLIITSILALLVAAGTALRAQDYPDEYLGLPGDNLNLYAVMKLFQESETLEGFERTLNDENSRINNLDLNGDNLVDYIMVNDYVDGDVHNIVLRVALGRNETQDVAVFTVQRLRDGSVQIQLIGDEALYGRNYIIEPIYDETPNPGYTGRAGNRNNVTVVRTTTYEVSTWPMIRFIYRPSYVNWRSSWYWGFYPTYWSPWRPFYWHYYYGYHYNWYPDYYRHYRHWQHPRYTRYNDFYYGAIRAHSAQVSNRIKEGNYKSTYSHPEQRRDGEDLYTRVNPGQGRRAPSTTTVNSQERRTVSRSGGERTSAGTNAGTQRRTSTTVTGKSGASTSSGKNGDVSRRSTTTVTNRTSTTPSSRQSAGTSQRSSTSADRSNVKSSSGQKTAVTRRSTTSANDRTASKPAAVQRGQSGSSSRQSTARSSSSGQKSSGVRSSSQKSVKTSKETSAKKSAKTKESDSGKSSRRK